jgi:hypothetical protein
MRKVIETKEFGFQGKKYQIRFIYNDISIIIIVFLNNKPVNSYPYEIYIKDYSNRDIVEEMVYFIKKDIVEQRYKEYLEVIKNVS